MAEKPIWYNYIFNKYNKHGLGMVIYNIHDNHHQFCTDGSENPKPMELMDVMDDIERDVKGLEFLYSHPVVSRKWRTHVAMGKKSF